MTTQTTQEPGASDAAAPAAAAPRGRRAPAMDLPRVRDYGIVMCFVALFVVLSVSSDAFLTGSNFANILEQWAPIGIMAAAGTLVLIAGGLDISVGAIYAISGVIAVKAGNATSSVVLGVLAGFGAGLGLGVFNGLITTVGRINSLIGTLGSGLAIRGLALVISGGFIVEAQDDGFEVLGRNDFLGLKLSVFVFAAWVLAMILVLHKTLFGRYIYAVGGNAEAARLSGVRVNWVRGVAFAVSGLSAGIAGVLGASRVGAGQGDVGLGFEFTVLAAIVLGGNSLLGGAGAIWRTILGVFILAMIGNGLNLLAIDPVYQQIVQGAIILLAVGVDAWAQRKRRT
jgi:ribose transport system permease protein